MSAFGGGCLCIRSGHQDVRVLDFRHSSLDFIPSDVFRHERTLEELVVDSNSIRELPRELFCCHGLHKLSLADNEVTKIPPAIASLLNLEELDVSKNGIVDIPDNIKYCKLMRHVDASVNPLGKLPEGFTQLLNMQELYLNDAFLDFLPGSLGRLSKLRILELRENHLKTLPHSMAHMTRLERLDLGNNEFTELPDVVGSLIGLLELWCDSNQIKTVPSSIGQLKQLMYLDASKNRIEAIPPEIEGCVALADLHLSINLLQNLPGTIGKLTNLTTLKVDDNRISALPFAIGGLVSLSELNLSANDLEELPPSVGLLRHLRTMYCDENFLLDIPSEMGSCSGLTVLSLRGNNLTFIPDEIGRIPRLRVLNLSDNKIQYLPFSLTRLKELQALWLSENQTKPLVRLQSDIDVETGQRMLTCYLLPQQPPVDKEAEVSNDDAASFHPSLWEEERAERQQIHFDFDDPVPEEGRLERTPTPYPKEMKNRFHHMRNLALKQSGMDNGEIGHKPNLSGAEQQSSEQGRRSSPLKSAGVGTPTVALPPAPPPVSSSLTGERHHPHIADKDKLQKDKLRIKHSKESSDIQKTMSRSAGTSTHSPGGAEADDGGFLKGAPPRGSESGGPLPRGATPPTHSNYTASSQPNINSSRHSINASHQNINATHQNINSSPQNINTSHPNINASHQTLQTSHQNLNTSHQNTSHMSMSSSHASLPYHVGQDGMSYDDFLKGLAAKGVPITEDLLRRSTRGTYPAPQAMYQQRLPPGQLYPNYHPHPSSRRRSGGRRSAGYESDTGYRSDATGYRSDIEGYRCRNELTTALRDGYSSDYGTVRKQGRQHGHQGNINSQYQVHPQRRSGYSSDVEVYSRPSHHRHIANHPPWIEPPSSVTSRSRANSAQSVASSRSQQPVSRSQQSNPLREALQETNNNYTSRPLSKRTTIRNDELYDQPSVSSNARGTKSCSRNSGGTDKRSVHTQRGDSLGRQAQLNAANQRLSDHGDVADDGVHIRDNTLSRGEAGYSGDHSEQGDDQWRAKLYEASVKLQKSPTDKGQIMDSPSRTSESRAGPPVQDHGGTGGRSNYRPTFNYSPTKSTTLPHDSIASTHNVSPPKGGMSGSSTRRLQYPSSQTDLSGAGELTGSPPDLTVCTDLPLTDLSQPDVLGQTLAPDSGHSSMLNGTAQSLHTSFIGSSNPSSNATSPSAQPVHTSADTSWQGPNYEKDVAVFKQIEPVSQVSSSTDSGYGHGHQAGERTSGLTSGEPSPACYQSSSSHRSTPLTPSPLAQVAPHHTRQLSIPTKPHTFHATVSKNPGLGFSIAGGVGSPGNPFRSADVGIFITRVQADGPGASLLRPGDKILEVNEVDFRNVDHTHAVDVLRTSGQSVALLLERA